MLGAARASVVLVFLSTLIGCAAPTEETDADESSDAVSSGGRQVTFRQVTMDVPAAHANVAVERLFSSVEELRDHFGESCGWFCNRPFQGRVPFQIVNPPGKTGAVVYINRADVPAGRELVISGARIGGNPKWVYLSTCTRAGRSRRYAFAQIEAAGTQPLIWVSGPEDDAGLQPCR